MLILTDQFDNKTNVKWLEERGTFAGLRPRDPRALREAISSYQTKFPKACECLQKDKEVLFTFYDFPAQHRPHLRTTNPIESTFATVRL